MEGGLRWLLFMVLYLSFGSESYQVEKENSIVVFDIF